MNSARNYVLRQLQSLNQSMTTSELAERLDLSRSVVSHYLNELEKEGYISRISGRPVRWITQKSQNDNNVFTNFIGARGSMRQIIKQVSAAIVYPPNGLNILITGHSGVGKSYLAGKIDKFAKSQKVIDPNSPYMVLNCADYANNPELVSSMLFGYVKGAYTGADEEKAGLLEQADGGYLFLDEVHRLSNENQEKLFSFIDSGQFYRMGDNAHPIKAKVRLILATTENPEDVLLTTFLRRIPVRLVLPDFISRPLDERLELLRYLFYQEAKAINKKIKVNKYVVSALVQTNHPGNIGYLKNIIKVSCAAAYHDQSQSETIELSLDDLLLEQMPSYEDYGDLLIDPRSPLKHSLVNQAQVYLQKLTTLFSDLSQNYSLDKLSAIKVKLLNLDQYIPAWDLKPGLHLLHRRFFKRIIEQRFGLSKTTYLEPLLYFLYESDFKLKSEECRNLEAKLTQNMPRAYHVATVFYKKLHQLDNIQHASLIIALTILLNDHVDEKIQLKGLIVAHGASTATSIQTVVNTLCGTYVFDAIDMPIEAGVKSITIEANKLIDSYNTTKGFVLMVDMGSLTQLYHAIKNHLEGDLLVVNNLTTLTALDLALKMQSHLPFKEIAEQAEAKYKIGVQYYEGFSESPNIIVSCISGMGISEKITEIVQPLLPEKIKVIPVDYAALKEKIKKQEWHYFDQTLFVLTTIDLEGSIPFKHMNLYDLLDASGEQNLHQWLSAYMSKTQIDEFNKRLLRFFSKEGISERLAFLNPDVILKEVEIINSKYENVYHLQLDGKIRLNLYMHIALMIERLMLHHSADIKFEPQDEQERRFFNVSHSIFQPIETKYNIQLTNYELSLLYELFKQFIDKQ